VTEQQLTKLVDRFYAKVRQDELLGPVFNAVITDWPQHLERLSAFWSSVMLTSGRYKGQPMIAHLKLKQSIQPVMFERWLALWKETASEILDHEGEAAVTTKAARIAESLQLGMFFDIERRGIGAAKEGRRACSNR